VTVLRTRFKKGRGERCWPRGKKRKPWSKCVRERAYEALHARGGGDSTQQERGGRANAGFWNGGTANDPGGKRKTYKELLKKSLVPSNSGTAEKRQHLELPLRSQEAIRTEGDGQWEK